MGVYVDLRQRGNVDAVDGLRRDGGDEIGVEAVNPLDDEDAVGVNLDLAARFALAGEEVEAGEGDFFAACEAQ